MLLGRRRSFATDGRALLDANPYPRLVKGIEHIPRVGTFVVVMNHYSRRGLRPYHCAFVVSVAVTDVRKDQTEIRWAFASEMYGQRIGPLPIPLWLVRWVFRRVAVVYDLVIVPRREDLVAQRAVALRRLSRALALGPVGLAPEAHGQGALVTPPEGAGLFLAALDRHAPLLPVAAWEEDDGTLNIRFGPPFQLSGIAGLSREELDDRACSQTMVAIGRLMPRAWWGAYAEAIIAAMGGEPTDR